MEKLYIIEDNMRCQLPGKIYFLTLLFLSYLSTALGETDSGSLEEGQSMNGTNQSAPCESSTKAFSTVSGADSSKKTQDIFVIQTPAAVNKMESSTLCMECLFQIQGNVWAIQWYKDGKLLSNSSRMSVFKMKGKSSLILSNIEIADSGIYRCILSDHRDRLFRSNGTQLTVKGITDLMVNQTPEDVNQREGTNVTIVCWFKTVNDYNSTDVRWYRDETLLNTTADSLRIKLDLKRGFSSLTLTNADETDSGDYRCRVEVRFRNLTGSGKASKVTITKAPVPPSTTEPDKPLGTSLATIGVGAGAGILILLLVVAGFIMWKRRSIASRSELETSPAKEIGLHPPLANQPSEVTYADLHFNKREVRPDAEVVYAEVRAPRKQQACQDAKQMRPAGNQRR